MRPFLLHASIEKFYTTHKSKFTTIFIIAILIGSFFALRSSALFRSDYSDLYYLAKSPNKIISANVIFPAPNTSHPLLHYTEHLTWLNSIGKSKRSLDRHSNAWTSNYAVGYWLSGQPKDLPSILKQLKGVFDPITLPASFAEGERDIVMREYDYSTKGSLTAQAAEAMDAFLYKGNGIADSVIGTPSQIKSFKYEDAQTLHRATHTPDKARLLITGDVTHRQIRAALKQAGWPVSDAANIKQTLPPFELAEHAYDLLSYPDANAAPLLIWRRAVALPEPVSFDLLVAQTALLQDILATNLPGGLAGPLRYDAAIARYFDVQIDPIDEGNIEIEISSYPDSGVTLTELQTAFETQLRAIATQGIPQATYDRALVRFKVFWPDWLDKDKAAQWIADYTVSRVSSLREPLSERDLKKLKNALSLNTTNILLTHLAGEGRVVAAFIGPEETFK